MGWWKIEGTESTVGDGPLEILGDAVQAVLAAYETEFRRRPTRSEWEALLRLVLGSEHASTRPITDRTVRDVEIKTD